MEIRNKISNVLNETKEGEQESVESELNGGIYECGKYQNLTSKKNVTEFIMKYKQEYTPSV